MIYDDNFFKARANPIDVNRTITDNYGDAVVEDMDWTEAVQNRGEAVAMGLTHGALIGAPEQFYRAIRSLASATGADDIHSWAGGKVDDIARERKLDPFYQVDPNWVKDEVGRSLYEGASSLSTSIISGLPAMGVGAMAASVLAPAAVGAGLTLGAAYVWNTIGGSAVAGLAEYDSFVDEAYDQLKPLNPNMSREELEDENFWMALLSGVSEGPPEIVH